MSRLRPHQPDLACFYCDASDRGFVRDHFVPKLLGGRDGQANRVDACWTCDKRKGSLHPRDWLRLCPPIGVPRVLAKMKELRIPLDSLDERLGQPGTAEQSPRRDGRSTSDGPGSWYGQPMLAPSWSRHARRPESPLPPLPLLSLRDVNYS